MELGRRSGLPVGNPWNREVGHLNLGTRLPPGGSTHTTLESDHWGSARTIYEARQVVERYVSTATAQPA